MSLEVIYITRHGFRSNWLVNPETGEYSATIRSPTGISADPPLTAHGVDQARELGAHLLTVDPPIEAVYSSPYYRCLQTISPFVELKYEEDRKHLGHLQEQQESEVVPATARTVPGPRAQDHRPLSIRPETGLAEWYGAAHFEHPSPATRETLKPMFPHYDENYQTTVVPALNGETIDELYHRTAAAAAAIIDQCDAEGIRAVVLCSHAAPIIALGRVLTGQVPQSVDVEDFGAFTCGLSVFRRKPSLETNEDGIGTGSGPESWKLGRGVRGGWTCEVNSDCSFLSSGEERGWRFSGDESFPKTDGSSQADAGMALGVVVNGKRDGQSGREQERQPETAHKTAGRHHL